MARLKAEGRAEDAAAVKALARPTAVAFVVNQLSRRCPEAARRLVGAGVELRLAQAALRAESDGKSYILQMILPALTRGVGSDAASR